MHNLAVFIQKYHYWFLFLFLELLSFILLFRHNGYQSSVWFTSANIVSGTIYEASAAVNQFFSLTELNTQLSQRNVVLEQQVNHLTEQVRVLRGDTLNSKTASPPSVSGM